MAEANVKQLTVTGNAAESFLKKGGSRRKRKSSANTTLKQEGGSPGTIVQIQANKAPNAPSLPSNAVSQAKPSTPVELAKTVTESAPQQTGGDKKPVKVILAANKKKPTKVILGPTKIKKAVVAEKQKTRKSAKKIRMSLNGLGRRVTRANTIRKEATKQPIEAVKKTLVAAKLIKPESKAPEEILRKMYADYMMLKNKAL